MSFTDINVFSVQYDIGCQVLVARWRLYTDLIWRCIEIEKGKIRQNKKYNSKCGRTYLHFTGAEPQFKMSLCVMQLTILLWTAPRLSLGDLASTMLVSVKGYGHALIMHTAMQLLFIARQTIRNVHSHHTQLTPRINQTKLTSSV